MKETELKNCRCGAEAKIHRHCFDTSEVFRITCEKCKKTTVYDAEKEMAIANRGIARDAAKKLRKATPGKCGKGITKSARARRPWRIAREDYCSSADCSRREIKADCVSPAARAWRLIWARRWTGRRREISVVSSVFWMGPKMAR